ncbi:acetyl-CoA carboxylase, biotin carboxylase subunit [Alkalithermobacter thermoalcaliphilus JW-YL-7 = DSM 7308]|uniref:Biotin carboxylase n=1 Tax=Alkalithermobacter thermoalcaliphilus JW-YL-7 = DSM 7308 TaxID=1121328 RepID=A0A150FQI6_CLOPD|nr:acetyl-CoA carboxylase, biotin carboxylase [[Clostridium] paradoxum JW-YL-7 = DSM 7308]SHK79284.1 acetyl-CoA carboxylase, biotin carboxylase subunit [[Clostridium] paradoxum JW-YL-7 = DSM 7308]
MINKVLIANRGEIAVRIIRTCKELGIKTVAIYSEIDKDSLHVYMADESICIGPNNVSKSYNNMDGIIYIALKTKCDAIHPGFGFLSENAEFAKKCEENNIIFIGPRYEHIEKMGDKSKARQTMINANVPVVPGSKGTIKDINDAIKIANTIGYPVLIKACAGGGGKGMRVAYSQDDLIVNFNLARGEALSSFGNDEMYLEKYIENPRHIEVQIFGDSFGNVIHLGGRDCTMQRRNQKLIEESLTSYLDDETQNNLYTAAINAAKSVGYLGAGTVEFIVDDNKNFYFIEMNTRIQVEHPVTEMITGIDLIKLQLLIASGNAIPYKQEDVMFNGHAIECRINAEDPDNNFRPCPGKINYIHIPGGIGVRWDSYIYSGYTIPPVYDSMIGKLIIWGKNRVEAINRMKRALDELTIEGIITNKDFQKKLISCAEFNNDTHYTKFIENKYKVSN